MNRPFAAIFLLSFSIAFSLSSPGSLLRAQKPSYVGSEVCGTCHEDIGKAVAKSPHQAVNLGGKSDSHGFAGKACESCHGPGSKHVETLSAADIRNPAKLSPAEIDGICLNCHRNQPSASGRIESSHVRNSIACTSCHSIHGPERLVARKAA